MLGDNHFETGLERRFGSLCDNLCQQLIPNIGIVCATQCLYVFLYRIRLCAVVAALQHQATREIIKIGIRILEASVAGDRGQPIHEASVVAAAPVALGAVVKRAA